MEAGRDSSRSPTSPAATPPQGMSAVRDVADEKKSSFHMSQPQSFDEDFEPEKSESHEPHNSIQYQWVDKAEITHIKAQERLFKTISSAEAKGKDTYVSIANIHSPDLFERDGKILAYRAKIGWVPELRESAYLAHRVRSDEFKNTEEIVALRDKRDDAIGREKSFIYRKIATLFDRGPKNADPKNANTEDPENLEGVFRQTDWPEVRKIYGILKGEADADWSRKRSPILAAASNEIPSGYFPDGPANLLPQDRPRIFRTRSGIEIKPLSSDRKAELINLPELPLTFESNPTDVMTIATRNGKPWEVETVPFGEFTRHPWATPEHYGGGLGWITGSVVYVDPETGGMYMFRAADHIRRAVKDAKDLGYTEVTEEILMAMLQSQLRQDKRWIPDISENPNSRRYYARFAAINNNIGPKLAGPNQEIKLMGTPIGPYKADVLKVVMLGPRPVQRELAGNKCDLNYAVPVNQFKPFAVHGYHEALFVREDSMMQEGCSANFAVAIQDEDASRGWKIITPDPEQMGILPGIVMRATVELARNLGYAAVYGKVDIGEILRFADSYPDRIRILCTGTAMGITEVGTLINASGNILYERPESAEQKSAGGDNKPQGIVGTLRENFDLILQRRHRDPKLNAWMERIA